MRTNHIFREKHEKYPKQVVNRSCRTSITANSFIDPVLFICHTRYMHIFCSYWFHHWWWCYLIGYYQCNDHALYKQSWCWFLWCRRRADVNPFFLNWLYDIFTDFLKLNEHWIDCKWTGNGNSMRSIQ